MTQTFDEDSRRDFDIIVTRSAGTDGAILVMIDGFFGEDGQPPLRILVNDEPVYSQVDYSGDGSEVDNLRDAGAVEFSIQPHMIAYDSKGEARP